MKRYGDWAPSGFDARGLALDDRQDWLVVPCGTNRDADALTRSNWRVVTTDIGESEDAEIHRFGHWACGWFEIMIVRPGTDAARAAAEWETALDNYIVASDDDFSQEEHDEAQETWRHCFKPAQRIEYIREHRSQFEFQCWRDMLSCVRGERFCGCASELLT